MTASEAVLGQGLGEAVPSVPPAGGRRWLAAGTALVMGAAVAYVLTNPGRIDMVDGQLRYEVLANLLIQGRPTLEDPALAGSGVRGLGGHLYTGNGFGSALASAPLMMLGMLFVADAEGARFLFALTSSLYGAGTLGILLAFYRLLGVPLRRGVGWALVLAFASLWWPLSVSTFDQAQHGFFLILAVYCAYRGARQGSPVLLLLGGLAGGLLINYAESWALVLPGAGLAALTPRQPGEPWHPRVARYLTFGAGCAVGLLLWFGFNEWRFGDPITSGRAISDSADGSGLPWSTFGNPLAGLLSLLVSPGKGIVFYSPPVILAAWGIGALWRTAPFLGATILATCAIHLSVVSSLTFFGGDWTWGPRYLVPLLPLCALPLPFIRRRLRRHTTTAVVMVGLLVQGMAVSLDHQRFFFERDLPPFFWADSNWFYFQESALFARPGEILRTLREGVPAEAGRFLPAVYPRTVTYALSGPNARNEGAARWMRSFSVFYLPRPWPLWFPRLPSEERPFAPGVLTGILLLALMLVGWALARTTRQIDPGS